ncbi:MAG: hypothetical protein GY832_43760 [Chloroflexi bacterium]|nr:hypothetical protein [Chloroflexota bacterium]
MLDRFQKSLQKHANGRTIFVLFIVLIALWTTLNLSDIPFGLDALMDHSGGLMILDLRIGYTPDQAYTLFEALGAEGRRLYGTMLLAGDILFPITYSLFFATIAAWLLQRVMPPNHLAQRLSLIAFVGGVADLAENGCILAMLAAFPNRLDGVAWASSLLKIPKFGSGAIGVPAILILAAMLAWKHIGSRRLQKEVQG